MVTNSSKISKSSKPRFISRKKRNELNALKESIASVTPASVDPPKEAPLSIQIDPVPHSVEEIELPNSPQETPNTQSRLSTWKKPLQDMTERDWKIVTSDLGITYSSSNHRPLRSWRDRNLTAKFKEPTPIQAAAIPPLLDGKDVIGIAPTGSGKTLAFCLPAPPTKLSTLILSPTRELAIQTSTVLTDLKIRSACLVGGRDFADQERYLHDSVAVVATPGRLIDFMSQNLLSLHSITYFVCDEADRMLDMGFGAQLEQITNALDSPQTAMFTATWSEEIDTLAKKLLREPIKIKIGTIINSNIDQRFEWVENKQHQAIQAIKDLPKPCIVFCNTKSVCDALEAVLPNSVALHSSRSQNVREESLARFNTGLDILIATDVVGRGIDITGVASVLNYDMPNQVDTYVHRIGRTGRAGRKGKSLTFLTKKDEPNLIALRKLLRDSGHSTRSLDNALR